mgnify:CR=1 FL=1|jgi:hypothetical protein
MTLLLISIPAMAAAENPKHHSSSHFVAIQNTSPSRPNDAPSVSYQFPSGMLAMLQEDFTSLGHQISARGVLALPVDSSRCPIPH